MLRFRAKLCSALPLVEECHEGISQPAAKAPTSEIDKLVELLSWYEHSDASVLVSMLRWAELQRVNTDFFEPVPIRTEILERDESVRVRVVAEVLAVADQPTSRRPHRFGMRHKTFSRAKIPRISPRPSKRSRLPAKPMNRSI